MYEEYKSASQTSLQTPDSFVPEEALISVSTNYCQVTVGSRSVDFVQREYELFLKLLQEVGKVLPRKQLCLWLKAQNGKGPRESSIDVFVCRMRTKLGEKGIRSPAKLIQTVRSHGYRLNPNQPIMLTKKQLWKNGCHNDELGQRKKLVISRTLGRVSVGTEGMYLHYYPLILLLKLATNSDRVFTTKELAEILPCRCKRKNVSPATICGRISQIRSDFLQAFPGAAPIITYTRGRGYQFNEFYAVKIIE